MKKNNLIQLLFLLLSQLGFAQESSNVFLLDNWSKSGLALTNDGSIFNDLTGFTINNQNYVAVGSTMGSHILSVSSNGMLQEVAFVPGASQGSNVTNRDAAFYDHYLYLICDDGYSTLQIVDVSFLPDSVVTIYDSDSMIQRAHSIYVDASVAKLYICGPKSTINGDRSLDVFSLANPALPYYLGSFAPVNYVHDCVVRNDTAWLNCANDGVYVVNFSSVSSPIILGNYDNYPEKGYNHSGDISENGKLYAFTDETPGKRIKLCDVSDPNDFQLLSLFNSGNGNQTIAHNLLIADNYVYVAHYFDGLQIFDIKNPINPQRVAWYDTHTTNEQIYSGAWGIYLFKNDNIIMVSDRQSGVFSFKFNAPPRIVETLDFGMFPNPASNSVWFYVKENKDTDYTIDIFSLDGKKIYSTFFKGKNCFINTEMFASGIYFYSMRGVVTDKVLTGKFIICHD